MSTSKFSTTHPEALMHRIDGKAPYGETVCCVNQPVFKDWFYDFISKTICNSGADGIVFDEPKDAHDACYCNICKSLTEDHSPEGLIKVREDSMAKMLGKLSNEIKRIDPEKTSIAMLLHDATDNLKQKVIAENIDYIGQDGPIGFQGYSRSRQLKPNISDYLPPFLSQIRQKNKKTYAHIITFSVQPDVYDQLENNLKKISDWDVDMFSFNYYGHDVKDPEGLMKILWKTIDSLQKG